jgi:prevent-host-death family protein
MREIQLRDAKARLSAVVDDALRGEEFVITRHGQKEAVVVSWETWRRLSNVPSFGRLLAAAPLEDVDLAQRDDIALRDTDL